jgi:hypothetical protein
VETVLRFRQGFYGLLADGWDVDDTSGKGARGRLPDEAVMVEHLVGLLDVGRTPAEALSAAEVNALLAGYAAEGRFAPARSVTDGELAAVRARIAELHRAWRQVAPGATLELAFSRRG